MKKLLKIFGILILVVIAVGVIAFISINARGIPTYDTTTSNYKAISTPESLIRGKKLTATLCASCHMNNETGKLTGKRMMDAPAEFGEIYSQNITGDKEHGIGGWTDAEILYLLRTGILKDGRYSPPYMAKLPNMADEDINAIISFLRSDDPLIAADPTPDKPCKPSFLTKLLSTIAFKPFPMPKEKIEMPDTNDALVLGEYLATNLECFSCHSADFKSNDFLTPSNSVGYYGGGNKPLDLDGNVRVTPNLTPDKETGIGNWSKEEFRNAVKYGQKKNGPALRYPMIPYSRLTDKEADAIFTYLQSIPPINNKIVRE